MVSPDEINKLFHERADILDENAILLMNKQSPGGELNNVVVRLERHCYSLYLTHAPDEKVYKICYINGDLKLEGITLQLTIDEPLRDNLTFYFAQYIARNYKNNDALDIFNTYQRQTRTLIEKLGYLTINPEEFKKYGDTNPHIAALGVKGIIRVSEYEKLTFYRKFFEYRPFTFDLNNETKYVYLMINQRNNLFKIGSSINPSHRERTLQSQEPEVGLVAYWQAPVQVEKDLHKKYKEKKKRGEWFNLSLNDIRLVKDFMDNFPNP